MAEFDDVAELYDATRGGEARGDEYAADIDALIPLGEGPILEIGVGTGVVSLGLARRGRRVIGLDLSAPMLRRARTRLGSRVVHGDALSMPFAAASVPHAVGVWIVHAVANPPSLFHEARRVLRPGGRFVVCQVQRPADDDHVGQIIRAMGGRIDERRTGSRPRAITSEAVANIYAAG